MTDHEKYLFIYNEMDVIIRIHQMNVNAIESLIQEGTMEPGKADHSKKKLKEAKLAKEFLKSGFPELEALPTRLG
jgi:hypothetical protein